MNTINATNTVNAVITGNYINNSKKLTVHKVLRPGYKLYCGTQCNDGRPITESWRYKQAVKMGIPIIRKAPSVASSASSVNSDSETKQMFVDKYSPKSVNEVIGHKEAINQITTWLQSWSAAKPPEVHGIIVTGPPGIGKTTCIHLIAKSLGYKVTEYNASDTRSVSVLRGLIALGVKRLQKEVIVMDEVDGLSERGGVGEIAAIIKKTITPIICIANEKPPKLRPIINACLDIKFNRPNKSTIATALLKVARAEKIEIGKAELEELCEKNGNDIRSILNNLEFYGADISEGANNKDANLRLDLFSATGRLIGNKRASLDTSAGLVFVDYNMIPLMVQEAYVAASKNSLEDAVRAAEFISGGDLIDKRIHTKHDWSLLPHLVQSTVSAARTVSGPAPFQIFPSWLGKNSKRMKHTRYMDDVAGKLFCSNTELRLDYADPLGIILLEPLRGDKPDIKGAIRVMDSLRLTRDDLMENLAEVMFDKVELPTKTKTAFTREYNKTHTEAGSIKKGKKRLRDEMEEDSEADEEEGDDENLENGLEDDFGVLEI
jgi:replication factor C subunit 1